MKTFLHLLAMPLAYPMHPSSQLGYLHSYIEREFKGKVSVTSYSAFLDILCDLERESMIEFFERYSLSGEEILFLVNCYHAARPIAGRDFNSILKLYLDFQSSDLNFSQQEIVPISAAKIAAFNDSMELYLRQKLLPSLSEDGLNVIGMTATFCQVFGSIFAANYIRAHTSKDVLFVFGGSSFSLPEASRTLNAWGVEGLLVAGSGEVPLAQIVQASLDLGPNQSHRALSEIDARNLSNVTRVGCQRKPIDLAMAKGFIEQLPDPNYAEFFSSLRSHCEDEPTFEYAVSKFVSIPLEGSRGCFAKCDFCHNPNITSEFRTLSGRKVAERALTMGQNYSTQDVTFVDSVCNTWAEDYADYLISQDVTLPAFMEMRVHAPETFWTKLALSGVTSIQLGVEAISEPLLQEMRKGTRVLQNLSATKYLAEMGLQNPSNLIIFHPKSTVADVEETKRILSLVEHFPIWVLSRFVVSYASPLYEELDEEKKSQLVRGFDWLPKELRDWSWPRHLSYTYPPDWIDADVINAWSEFQRWNEERTRMILAQKPVFNVRKNGTELIFVDTRFGEDRQYSLSNNFARVYDICHHVSKASTIAQRSNLPLEVVDDILHQLVDLAMIVKVGERYLSLALRPPEELIDNLSRGTESNKAVFSRTLPMVKHGEVALRG